MAPFVPRFAWGDIPPTAKAGARLAGSRGGASVILWVLFWGSALVSASAGSIETAFLERPWPKQSVHEYEVGRTLVRWRQKASAAEGLLAGAEFVAPSSLQRTWTLATDYSDLGPMTPGVSAVKFLERTPTHHVIQIDLKVLWKTLRLVFEIDQDPPKAVRFRLVNERVGEYRGVCLMAPEGEQTHVELATWLKPAGRVPRGLILSVERMVMLRGIRNFVTTCRHSHVRPVAAASGGVSDLTSRAKSLY